MQLIVLASGRGSRLENYTNDKPKCLVEVRDKPIISYLKPAFKLYKEVIIITGYKSNVLQNYLKKLLNVNFINNLKFEYTNMVESLFLANQYINDDVVICYSDIIFDLSILKNINKYEQSTIAIYQNWLKLWQKRMNKHKIIDDAEDLRITKNKVTMIGEKIKQNAFPQFQFMGIIKLKKNDYKKLHKFYSSFMDRKIDLTSFLNIAISNGIIDLHHHKTNKFWFEVDSVSDLILAESVLDTNFLVEQNKQRF